MKNGSQTRRAGPTMTVRKKPRVRVVWVIEHSFLGGTPRRRLPKSWVPHMAFCLLSGAKDYIRCVSAREHYRIRPYRPR